MTGPDANAAGAGGVDGWSTGICAVVLAAGEGTRLRPLTERVPKALCPVGNLPLLDRTLARLARLGLTGPATVAVNACYLADQVVRRVGERAHLSVETGGLLGTGGGVGNLRRWIDGRGVLVGNADAYLAGTTAPGPDIATLLTGWDGHTVRMLGVPESDPARVEFGRHRFAGFSLLPWHRVRDLPDGPSSLYARIWRPADAVGELEIVEYRGRYLDTGTPADYLAANLHAAGGGVLVDPTATVTGDCSEAVIGAGAVVRGTVRRAVVWPGGAVAEGEVLTDAVRAGDRLTVPVHL